MSQESDFGIGDSQVIDASTATRSSFVGTKAFWGIIGGSIGTVVVVVVIVVVVILVGKKTSESTTPTPSGSSSRSSGSTSRTSGSTSSSSAASASSSCTVPFCNNAIRQIRFNPEYDPLNTYGMSTFQGNLYDDEEVPVGRLTGASPGPTGVKLVSANSCTNLWYLEPTTYISGCRMYIRLAGANYILFQGNSCDPNDHNQFTITQAGDNTQYWIQCPSLSNNYLQPIQISGVKMFTLSSTPFVFTINPQTSC